ncbi:hypothetical protein L1887_42113 [Cichorium endivia]|nr:hypothetical protein L1887_42113 [Cichorium endivia]
MSANALTRAFPKALKEVRLHLCQTGQASAGARKFLESNYKPIKQSNPDVPFLVREASGTPARAFARFERGVEKRVELDGLSSADVEKKIGELLSSACEWRDGQYPTTLTHKLAGCCVAKSNGSLRDPSCELSPRGSRVFSSRPSFHWYSPSVQSVDEARMWSGELESSLSGLSYFEVEAAAPSASSGQTVRVRACLAATTPKAPHRHDEDHVAPHREGRLGTGDHGARRRVSDSAHAGCACENDR